MTESKKAMKKKDAEAKDMTFHDTTVSGLKKGLRPIRFMDLPV